MRMANGFGGVVYLGKNRRKPYAARVTVGWSESKRQIFKYIGYFENKMDALAALIEYNKNPYDLAARKLTFAEIYDAWSAKHYETISNGSIIAYKGAYNKCASLYNIPFAEIKTAHLQAVIDEYKNSSSVRIVKVVVGFLYDYAIKNDIVEKDYSKFIELPKKEKKREKIPFTADEIALLWKHKNDLYIDMILVLLYSGMRISELLDMKIEKIDLENRVMVGGVKTSAGINRTIPIHADIAPIIRENMEKHKVYLFETPRGKKHRYGNVGQPIIKAMQSLGLDHTIHETRHTFISQCSRLGIDPVTVKRIVGHSTKDITEHYTHKNADDLIAAIDEFKYF